MPINLQYGPSPGAVGMAAFSGGQGKARNDAARQYMPLVEEQNRQRFLKQQAQQNWEQQYKLAMMHLAASGITAQQHQQFLAQQNAMNRQNRLEAARLAHPGKPAENANQWPDDIQGPQPQQQPAAFNPARLPGIPPSPGQQIQDLGSIGDPAADPRVASVGRDPNHPMANVLPDVGMPTFGSPNQPLPAMPGGSLQRGYSMNDSQGMVDTGRRMGPGSTMAAYMQNVPGGTAQDYTGFVQQYGNQDLRSDSGPYGGQGHLADVQAMNEQSFQRGMGNRQPGQYDQAYQQALQQRDAWRGNGPVQQVDQGSLAGAEGGLAAKGYVKGPRGWYKPAAQAQPPQMPDAPEQDPRAVAKAGLVPPLPDKHQELYSQYQSLLG